MSPYLKSLKETPAMTSVQSAPAGKCPVAHDFNAMSDAYFLDPGKYIDPFRNENPTFFYPLMNAWVVTGREDAIKVLTDWKAFSSTANSAEMDVPEKYREVITPELMSRILLGSDPEGHTKARGVAQLAFLEDDIIKLQPEIEARANRLIDSFEERGEGNLIEDYLIELTTQTIMAHMGLDYEYTDFMKQLRDDFFSILSSAHEPVPEAEIAVVWERYIDANLKLRELIESRRESDARDVISIMASQQDAEGEYILGADQIAIHLTEFASAGTDTTAQAMANAILFLQQNPEAKQEAILEPELWPRVFEETIRRRNSSTFTSRLSTVDIEIGGAEIKKGDRILVSLTSANTDPEFVDNPFDFDIHRPDYQDHLAFSTGRHKCLGNPLARVQAPTGLQVLFERLPSINVTDPEAVNFIPMALMPARRSLDVTWELEDINRSKTSVARTLDLKVAKRVEESEGVVSLTLVHPDGGELPAWKPGAHIDLHLGDDLVRQYSLCGDPEDTSSYRIGVLREVESRGGSTAVHDTLFDDTPVTVSWPRNNFRFTDMDNYLFIAGGIGITPILTMVRGAERRGKNWKLIYGGRTRSSMAFLSELEQYGERVQLIPQDELGHPDLDGLLAEAEESTLIYSCGPEGLLQAVEEKSAHWPKNRLRLERFAPKLIERDYDDAPFEVEFADSGSSVTIGAGESILDAAARAGLTVLSSCKEGTCGTCETPVLSGKIDHRDSILTEDEQAANDTMMICVSRAARGCGKIVLQS